MANANDPLGWAAERILLNARQTSLGTQISGWTGDYNGLSDLRIKQQEVHDRLNLASSGVILSTVVGVPPIFTAYSGFGLPVLST